MPDLNNIGAKIANSFQTNNSLCSNPPQYVFPKEALESDTPLPQEVRDSFKSTVGITVQFIVGYSNIPFMSESLTFGGSGFVAEEFYVSARHIFFTAMLELSEGRSSLPFTIDKNGLPQSNYYHTCFYGTADVNGKPVTFPLELVAMGDPYLDHDFAVFKAIGGPPLKSLVFEEEAELGDITYSSGRLPSFLPLNSNLNPIRKATLMDFFNYIFTGYISAILTDMPNNKESDIKKMYRIGRSINTTAFGYFGNNVEPGYSGGPVLAKNGRVIGMTVLLTHGYNFSHAISAKDLKLFIQKVKNKKP